MCVSHRTLFTNSYINSKNEKVSTKRSTTSQRREDIISKPIGAQLLKLTVPMLYAIVAIMGLGVVDSYFISFLGTSELAAIALIVPITAIITGIGLGMGMAISSLTSKLIGADNLSSAARLITDGFYLTGGVALVAIALLAWQLDTIFTVMGADMTTKPHILAYMRVWIFATPLIMFTMTSASTFRAIGDTTASAQISIYLTLINLLLDPLLIFGLGPFPALGMVGAAWATLIAALVAFVISIYKLGAVERLLIPELPQLNRFKSNAKKLIEIAIPAVLANMIVPLSAAVLTRMVTQFGNDAVAGYGVGTRIESVSLIIVYALSSTLPMFIGQNLGAQKWQRIHDAIKLTFRFVLILQLGVYIILALGAASIAQLFSEQFEVQETIRLFLWIVPLTYGLSGIVILVNVAMNVLGKPKLALYINLLRLLVFYIPCAWIGSQWFGLLGLFVGIAIGNSLAYLLAYKLLHKTLHALKPAIVE